MKGQVHHDQAPVRFPGPDHPSYERHSWCVRGSPDEQPANSASVQQNHLQDRPDIECEFETRILPSHWPRVIRGIAPMGYWLIAVRKTYSRPDRHPGNLARFPNAYESF
ncbi:hypothetical protein KFL_006930080 [Klebsormidium nitens]|uniref:Uncharacterized protein n=1 Tax=Klebsormidium nitens TaxID=105231 RepID=A0A1Y1IJ04_KLENI|nr:hypothetical protein KFL_006930080 [Klebsormidium nitens]|eukprot:GAQ90860.1 hypothetical protein KFL_006930080 [Klebsormidium nitens]